MFKASVELTCERGICRHTVTGHGTGETEELAQQAAQEDACYKMRQHLRSKHRNSEVPCEDAVIVESA